VSVSYDLLSSVGSNQTYGIFEVKAFGRASSMYFVEKKEDQIITN